MGDQLIGSAGDFDDDLDSYSHLSDYLGISSKPGVFAKVLLDTGQIDNISDMKYFRSYPEYRKFPWRKIKRTICKEFARKGNNNE